MATVGRGADQYTVRFPDGLRDRIKDAASSSGRSMNDLIVEALEEKYPPPPVSTLVSETIAYLNSILEQHPDNSGLAKAISEFGSALSTATKDEAFHLVSGLARSLMSENPTPPDAPEE